VRITYTGPHDGVEIPALTKVVVKLGETIEVSDDLGARLIEQRTWEAEPAELLAWVGKDTDRAARLLTAERDGAHRGEVLDELDRIANPPAQKPTKKPAGPGPRRATATTSHPAGEQGGEQDGEG
jgi:hypothetical protein